ncbi:GtrA family protein [Pseudomonas kielensis]|uniref:GtrA family protein n=1 Tax=Pseudomonas kielensis TaxID=2762577 RepID=UPI0038A56B0A
MNAIWKGFLTYALVGLANTLIHWQVFFVLRVGAGLAQSNSNLAAFGVAASFSLYVNTLYTFESGVVVSRYVLFLFAMAALSFVVGHLGDRWLLHGFLTVAAFSLLSLGAGFLFTRFVGSRGHPP